MLHIRSCGRSFGTGCGIRTSRRNRARVAADGPTDPQIAHIAYTAGDIDIKAAQQALQISKNENVRAFANDMVRDHTAVNDKALALVKKLNVTPEDNDTSKGSEKQAEEKRAELAKLSGAAFDKAYVDNEVAFHKTVDGALADDAHTLVIERRTEEPAPDRSQDFRRPLEARRASGKHVEVRRGPDANRNALLGPRCCCCKSQALTSGSRARSCESRSTTSPSHRPKSRSRQAIPVEWVNNDFIDHTATATGGEWDVMIVAGQSARQANDQTGTIKYFCRVHPDMTGTIHVVNK